VRILASALAVGVLGVAASAAPAGAADSATCNGLTADITGTTGDDSGVGAIQGTSADEVIVGLEGNDEIDGGGGNDLICAGSGNDEIDTGSGDDYLLGMDGEDDLTGGAGTDYLDGGRGADKCSGGGQPDDLLRGCSVPTQFLVGQRAPDFAGRTAYSNKFRLRDLEGQNVLLDFSAIHAPVPQLASRRAGIQSTLRDAGVEFTYVLVELEDVNHDAAERHTAEFMLERWSLQQSPVVHAGGSINSAPYLSFLNFSSENFPYESDQNVAFPTLVFIDPQQMVTEVHQGSLGGQAIVDRYGDDLPEPPTTDPVQALLPGDNIERIRSEVKGLSLKPKLKRPLLRPLMHAIQSIETRLKPERTPCFWLKRFRKVLTDTPGVSPAKDYILRNLAFNVKAKLDC
jgi:hypothetical protein